MVLLMWDKITKTKSVFVSRASKRKFLKGERKLKRASLYTLDDPVSPLIQVLGLTASHCILYISPVVTKHWGDMQSLITIMDFFPSVGFDLQALGQILQPLLLPAALYPSSQPYFIHGELETLRHLKDRALSFLHRHPIQVSSGS